MTTIFPAVLPFLETSLKIPEVTKGWVSTSADECRVHFDALRLAVDKSPLTPDLERLATYVAETLFYGAKFGNDGDGNLPRQRVINSINMIKAQKK